MVTVVDDMLPSEINPGEWLYYVKLNTNDRTEYIDSSVLAAGQEIAFAYTNFYEMSETAYEKYTFDDYASTKLTKQRLICSISGTALETKSNSIIWVEHNGQKAWMEYQDMAMLKRWAKAREYQLIFGKGTVNDKDEVILKDLKGRDIMSGDGLLNQGDGALKFQYNVLTEEVIHNVMKNMQLFSNSDGKVEIAVIAGQDFIWDFTRLMVDKLKANPEYAAKDGGKGTMVKQTFESYEYAGVRFIPVWYKFFDSPERPTSYDLTTGRKKESGRAIFVSLGNVDTGEPNIELLSLGKRSFLRGTVSGINDGGDNMANSVDGKHVHILAETGIAVKNIYGVAELYIP